MMRLLFAKREADDDNCAPAAELPRYRSPDLARQARHDSATAPDFRRGLDAAVITDAAAKLATVCVEIYANVAFRPSETVMRRISDEF